jgi:hypothetical protein
MTSGGRVVDTTETCKGTTTTASAFDVGSPGKGGEVPMARLVGNYDHIRSGWKPFDPDGPSLEGTDSWTEDPVTSPDRTMTCTVRNTLTWSLQRVYE